MGDASALQSLSVEDADAIRKLPAVLAQPDTSAKRRNLINILGLRVFSEPAYARAMGLAWALENVAACSRTYKVEGLDTSGKTTGLQLASPPTDASVATPLPPSPTGVQVKVDQSGVSIFWAAPAENRQLPVIVYAVERDSSGQTSAPVTAKPIVPGVRWDPKLPLVLDRNAPSNETLTYYVYATDIFGRRSAGTSIRIFFPDYHASSPPDPVTATAGVGKVVVSLDRRAETQSLRIHRRARISLRWPLRSSLCAGAAARHRAIRRRHRPRRHYLLLPRVLRKLPRGPRQSVQRRRRTAPESRRTTPGEWPDSRYRPNPSPPHLNRRKLSCRGILCRTPRHIRTRRHQNWVRLNSRVTPEPLYDDPIGLASDVSSITASSP